MNAQAQTPLPTPTTPLRTVTIENFRGIRHMELELDPRVTVLFGRNAAGKSTVLDALAIGLGTIVTRIPKVSGRSFAKSGDLRVPYLRRPQVNERPRVEARFAHIRLESAKGLVWGVTSWRSPADRRSGDAKPTARELHKVVDELVLKVLDAEPGTSTAPIPLVVAYGNERAVLEVPLRQRGFRTEFQRFEAFDQALVATTRFKAVFEWFVSMEDEDRRKRLERAIFGDGPGLPEMDWVRQAVGKAGLGCSDPRTETRPLRMMVDFEHGDGEREPLDIKSLSDGYRTHFALVVDLARRMVQLNPSPDLNDPARGTNSPAVVLIDEVDLHLDPQWQARVVPGLLNAFPNAQFVLTTHSEQVLGSVQAESVRRLAWRDGEIVAEPVPFAQGATGERILIDLMGAAERVPGPVTDRLRDYLALVDQGEGETDQARALRRELDASLPQDARLHQADLEMQRRALLERMRDTS